MSYQSKILTMINFQALPQITPFNFGEDEEINLDEAVAVTCIVTKGDLPIHIWWTLKNEFSESRNLTTNDGVVITRNGQKISLLTIEAVKSRHRGNYTCYAMNKAGVTGHSAYLQINGDYFYSNQKRKCSEFIAICFLFSSKNSI